MGIPTRESPPSRITAHQKITKPLDCSFQDSFRATKKMLTTECTETTEKSTSACAGRDYDSQVCRPTIFTCDSP